MRRERASIAALLFVLGCGARTELLDFGSSPSSGGSAPSTSTASGSGAGGAGGAPSVVCPTLVVDDRTSTVVAPGAHLTRPALISIGTPGVSLVFNATVLGPLPEDSLTTPTIASFDPWHDWPPALHAQVITYASSGSDASSGDERPFAISRAADSDDGTFQFAHSELADGVDCLFLAGTLGADAVLQGGGDCEHVYGTHLLSMARRVGRNRRIDLAEGIVKSPDGSHTSAQLSGWLSGPDSSPKVLYDQVGCALDSVKGGVVATNDSWLVAAALGAPFGWSPNITADCAGKFLGVGRPRGVYAGHVATDGKTFSGNEQLAAESADVTGFAIAPSEDGGAWIAWGVAAGSASAAVRVARIDDKAHTALGAVTLSQASGAPQPTSVALAVMGSRAIVAVVEAVGDTEQIVVHQIDASGAELAAGLVPLVGTVSGALAVVADPTEGIVVGWSGLDPGATEEFIRLAKLTCATPG